MSQIAKEKIVFYFPWKELSGGPFYLTALADNLAEQGDYEVYYTDYKHGLSDGMIKNPTVKKIEYTDNDFVMPLKEPITLVTPIYWAHKVPELHPKSKIIFFNWHYCCIPVLKHTADWPKYKLNKFLELVKKTNSCFFLDYSHLMGQNTKKINFKEIIVPITLNKKNIIAKKNIIDTEAINIGILGRIDGDKAYSILNVIDNLINLKSEKIINLHIIGDGIHRNYLEQEISQYGSLLHNINIIMHGVMIKDELNNFMANNIDILFAMGTSAIEGAALHLPTVIIPSNSKKFKNNDFVWLHNSVKFSLGWFNTQISELGIMTQPISEILDAIYNKNLKDEYGELDFEYYLKNHTSNINNFIEAINQSSLNYKQLQKITNMFDCKLIYNVKNSGDRKIITIFGIKIKFKSTLLTLQNQILNLKNEQLNLKNSINSLNDNTKLLLDSLCYQSNLYNKVSVVHGKVFPKYKNLHIGETAVLIASGPTVQNFNPEIIEDAKTKYIAVNGSFAYDKVNFDYLFLQDYSGLKDSIAKIPFAKNIKDAKKFYGVMSPVPNNMIIPESIVNRDNAERYYAHSVCYDNGKMLPRVDYAVDLSAEFFMCHGTIPLIAMQFLLYAGFKKIYLVGCDCSTNGHFSEKMEKQVTQASELGVWLLGWKKLKDFVTIHYPDVEIISVNPIGLKDIFKNVYTNYSLKN